MRYTIPPGRLPAVTCHSDRLLEDERFEERGVVGEGSMGTVRRAWDRHLNRFVAIKTMSFQSSHDSGLRGRFLGEAQITAQLEHPNIVPVHSLEQDDRGAPSYSMKLIEGQTMAEYLRNMADLDLADRPSLAHRLEHFLKVCDAIAYAHERGVLHRDLKPDNIMLGPFNEVYVMDWGIARAQGDEHDVASVQLNQGTTQALATRAGEVFGTPRYMSPEQAAGERTSIGPASDQYALGLVLYEMTCLHGAYEGTTLELALTEAIAGTKRPMTLTVSHVPPDLAAIIHKATQLQIVDRYADVGSMARDVRRFLEYREVAARPDNLFRSTIRWMGRHRGLAVAGVLCLILVVVLAAGIISTASLSVALQTANEQADREHALSAVMSHVTGKAQDLDAGLHGHQAKLEALASAAISTLEQPSIPTPVFSHIDFTEPSRRPADAASAPRYHGQVVSFEHPVFKLAPGVDQAQVSPDLYRLALLGPQWRALFLRSHSEDAMRWDGARQSAQLSGDGVPILWSYVALEEGVHTSFPGHTGYPDAYDPRARPWYRLTRGTRGIVWSAPYVDVNGFGLILPCNMALYDHKGTFRGVAGVELAFDDVIGAMDASGAVPGFLGSWLVDDQGRVIVSTDDQGQQLGAGLHNNAIIEREVLPYPEVVLELAGGSGAVHVGNDLFVFSPMKTLNWSYVVRLDARQLGL
jgi:serine/threonine protein kinase